MRGKIRYVLVEMKGKASRRFHIKIFDEHDKFVEGFALSANTKRNVKKMVRERMQINDMSEGYTFTVS